MTRTGKIIVVTTLALAVIGAVALKQSKMAPHSATTPAPAATNTGPPVANITPAKAVPKLVDLGAGKCIPCRMMAPILEGLKKDYTGQLDVTFLDVWQNPDLAKQYGVEAIPTQIFYGADGKELFRHAGFFGREDILAKWKELGVDLSDKPSSSN